MNQIFDLIKTTLELALIYSLVVLGTYLTSRIIKFDDLTTEGSFSAGGAFAALILCHNLPVWISIISSIVLGCIVGMITGILHTKLKLNNLISGIVVSTGLFSINLKMVGANIVLERNQSIFAIISNNQLGILTILAVISIICVISIQWFLRTEVGKLITAIGCNPQLLLSLGKNLNLYKILCLMIANAIIALAGALLVNYTGFYSITGNIGTLVTALAGLIIGQTLCKNSIFMVIIGAIGYQTIIALTIELQLDPAWNRLITALLIIILIALRNNKKDSNPKRELL
jgi:putative ABC transport system permease protein